MERMKLLRAQMDVNIMPVRVQAEASALRPAINIEQVQKKRRLNAEQPAGVGRDEERKNIEEKKCKAEENSDTFRESQLVPGADPEDVNTGKAYIFIKDDAIDKVIRELKTSGLYENSVILITTDNGGGNYFGARLTQLKVIICKISKRS